jgi:hypothetical protein
MPTVVTNDGVKFEINSNLFSKCKILCEDFEIDVEIPLNNVNSKIFMKMIWFSENGSLKENENYETLVEIATASNFLDYNELLEHCAKLIAESLKGKSPKEVREILGLVPNDQ